MPVEYLLTPEEFAEKLRIGRSTLFEWMRMGLFTPGKHYIKVNRILRFIWSDDILAVLAEATCTTMHKQQYQELPQATGKDAINWDY